MRKKTLVVMVLIAIFLPLYVFAAGLTANFGEVVISNLRIGQQFNTRQKANLPYVIKNVGPRDIEIKIDVLVPKPNKAKSGYQPIPDKSWLKLEKDFFHIPPNGEVSTDIIFDIPNDKTLLGKKFQVVLNPYTYEGILKIGVNSNILFTIDIEEGPYPIVLGAKEFQQKKTFELSPLETTIDNLALGKKVSLQSVYKASLVVTNTTDQEVRFFMNTIRVKDSQAKLKEGYEDTPDPDFLTFSEDVFKLKPKESKTVKLYLNFPKDDKYAGKKYMFLIAVVLGEQEVPMIRYAYLYVTTKAK